MALPSIKSKSRAISNYGGDNFAKTLKRDPSNAHSIWSHIDGTVGQFSIPGGTLPNIYGVDDFKT